MQDILLERIAFFTTRFAREHGVHRDGYAAKNLTRSRLCGLRVL